MKLSSLRIHNGRGISNLELQLDGESIAIWGPNGVGKSSVVDAIEFLFTGRISRLTGEGTAGISLSQHGHHINYPAKSALVSANVQLEGFADPVQLTRRMAKPDTMECPEEARARLIEMGTIMSRGGAILTRRDVLRYVTAQPGARSQDIQTLLNLKEIDTTRQSLVQAQNQLKGDEANASKAIADSKADVNTILGGSSYSDEGLLAIVNECRVMLGVHPLDEVNSSMFKSDIFSAVASWDNNPSINPKQVKDLFGRIQQQTREDQHDARRTTTDSLRKEITKFKENTTLLRELEQLELTNYALRFITDSTTECPVCGATWTQGHLSAHLLDKKATASVAEEAKKSVTQTATAVVGPARSLRADVAALKHETSSSLKAGELQQEIGTLTRRVFKLDQLVGRVGQPHGELQ